MTVQVGGLVQRGRLALFVLAGLLLGVHLLVYASYTWHLLQFEFDYDQGEGFELVDTILFSEGHWPYRDNEVYPFYASNYPPLYHVLLVPFVWVFGPDYWYGRLMGFVGTLVTATTIGLVVLREGRSRPIALFSGLAFLASNTIYHIGPLFRQHMTMVMFETLAVAVIAGAVPRGGSCWRRGHLALGLLLLLAAGFTKQLAIATALAVFVFLYLRSPRRSLIWGAFFGTAGAAIFAWMTVATDGAWWTNAIAANVNPYMEGQFWGLLNQWLRLHGVLIVLALIAVVAELYFGRLSLYSLWWVCALGTGTLSGKWGAGDSYFATAIAATCLLAGIVAARALRGAWTLDPAHVYLRWLRPLPALILARRSGIATVAGLVVPTLYLVYGLGVIKLPTDGAVFGSIARALSLESTYGERYAFYDSAGAIAGYATIGHFPTRADNAAGWRIVERIKASGKPALSEEAAFSLRAGVDVVTNPTQLKNLYENDLYDPTTLIAAIEAQAFGVAIFRAEFYPPPVLQAVYRAYYPDEQIVMNGFPYTIWQPGPPLELRDEVVAGLGALRSGARRTFDLPLPVDPASRWFAHLLRQTGWGDEGALTADEDCFSGRFSGASGTISAALCPNGSASSTLVLEGEGS